MAYRGSIQERFWKKVQKTDTCWIWIASTAKRGYGSFQTDASHAERAHRVSYRLAYGDIPEGMCVLHSCDNPACVRPEHLRLGTQQENIQDRQDRAREARGERNARSKLSEQQVQVIKRRLKDGEVRSVLAKEYGTTWKCIDAISKGRSWSWLD